MLPDESDITRMKPDEFYENYSLPAPNATGTDRQERKQEDSLAYNELWPWAVVALLGLLVAEYWVAGRTPG